MLSRRYIALQICCSGCVNLPQSVLSGHYILLHCVTGMLLHTIKCLYREPSVILKLLPPNLNPLSVPYPSFPEGSNALTT